MRFFINTVLYIVRNSDKNDIFFLRNGDKIEYFVRQKDQTKTHLRTNAIITLTDTIITYVRNRDKIYIVYVSERKINIMY